MIFVFPKTCGLKLLLLFLPSTAKVRRRYSFLLSFELLITATINFMAVKLFILRPINPKSYLSLQLQMVCKCPSDRLSGRDWSLKPRQVFLNLGFAGIA